jgi:hypothetical protein
MEQPIVYSKSYSSELETEAYRELTELLFQCPIPNSEILANLALFMNRSSLSDLLFMHNLYQRIIRTHGVIFEFGTRWGRNLALFSIFRTLYEPHNFFRKIVGFDTFSGFPSVSKQDGTAESVAEGVLSVTPEYQTYLTQLLSTQEKLAPRSHLRKFELVRGDVTGTLPAYLEENPETIVALAYFDMDLYEPTKHCLELIKPHLVKGSVIGFDELAIHEYPGETVAFRESLAGSRLQRDPIASHQSFVVIE